MAVTSTRSIAINFTGDVVASNKFNAATNLASPGKIDIVTLVSGDNTITPPITTPVAVTIIPPSGNDEIITLKGVNGDTGIELHLTDPTSIGLNSPTNTFVLNASDDIIGVRLVWS